MTVEKKLRTNEKILLVSRRLFNRKGYAATSLTEIADAVGISQGNLSYHFPTKKDLAERLQAQVRERARTRLASLTPGPVADDYVAHLLFAMSLMWENRFIFRDRIQYSHSDHADPDDPDMAADFAELYGLVRRIEQENMFRRELPVDLEVLTRSLWILSRYWMDYLREHEGREEITWQDQERGIQHHFAVLLPCLLSSAQKLFWDALVRLSDKQRGWEVNSPPRSPR